MKHRLNRKLIIRLSVLAIITALLFGGAFAALRARYAKENEARLSAVAEAVRARYPDVPEEELLNLLRDPPEAGESFFRKYGLSEGDLAGTPERGAFTGTLIAGLGALAFFALGAGALYLFDARRRKQEAESLTAYLDAVAAGDYGLKIAENAEGDYSALSNRLYDLTVRLREVADTSRRNSEALSRWLMDISHQIRTPLTSAVIMVDALADPATDADTRREFLDETSRQLDVIESLLDSLLRLAKLESGTVTLSREPLTARALIDNVRERLCVLLDLRGVTLEAGGDFDEPFPGDPSWQTEALSNVVKNCAEHSPEGSVIRLTAEAVGVYLRLTVDDEGEGIDDADLPHIFERFYKAKNAGPNSVGIGLNLAKTVIEAQNGYITVRSEKNKGTRFTIGYKR